MGGGLKASLFYSGFFFQKRKYLLLRDYNHLYLSQSKFSLEQTHIRKVFPVCFPGGRNPCKIDVLSILKEKNLLPWGAFSFLKELILY